MADNTFKHIPKEEPISYPNPHPPKKTKLEKATTWLSQFSENSVSYLAGTITTFFTLAVAIALVSFIYTGKADQSLVEGMYSNTPTTSNAQNWLGLLGATLSYFLVQRWFGISAFLLVIVGLTGSFVLFKKFPFQKWKDLTILLVFVMVMMGILLGYLVYLTDTQSDWAFLCGGMGYAISAIFGAFFTPLIWVGLVGLFAYVYGKERLNAEFYGNLFAGAVIHQKEEKETEPEQELVSSQIDKPIASAEVPAFKEVSPTNTTPPIRTEESLETSTKPNPKNSAGTFWRNLFSKRATKPKQSFVSEEKPNDKEDSTTTIPQETPIVRRSPIKDDMNCELPKKELPKQEIKPVHATPQTENTTSSDSSEKDTSQTEFTQKKQEKYYIPTAEDFGLKPTQEEHNTEKNTVQQYSSLTNDVQNDKPSKKIHQPVELPPVRPSVNRVRELYDEPEDKLDELLKEGHLEGIPPYNPHDELPNFETPPTDLLDNPVVRKHQVDREELSDTKMRIEQTLKNFKIDIKRIHAEVGPTVTLYEIVPAAGVKIAQIRNLGDDIALNLAALGIRIIAPMPGKGTIGIEVPNKEREIVPLRTLLENEVFKHSRKELPLLLGKDISNQIFIADLTKMPHLLIGGATGQGKSVGINVILTSLIYKKHPTELKFVMIDPKKVEFSLFAKLEKHYLAHLPDAEPIVTDAALAVRTLEALCREMDERYDLLKAADCRNVKEYNQKFKTHQLAGEEHRFLPYIVLVIDELADLMIIAGKAAEKPIARLAQMARAIGIHLIVATQRPSVNVVTGIIKANFPARMAFRVTSKIDSRIILDATGAEQLIGQGDMLLSNGSDILRLQCAFIDTPEVERVCKFIQDQKGFYSAYPLPEELNFDVDEEEQLPGDELF